MITLWAVVLTLALALEVWSLLNGKPGDTLSGLIWRAIRRVTAGRPRLRVAVFVALSGLFAWAAYHFALQPTMPH